MATHVRCAERARANATKPNNKCHHEERSGRVQSLVDGARPKPTKSQPARVAMQLSAFHSWASPSHYNEGRQVDSGTGASIEACTVTAIHTSRLHILSTSHGSVSRLLSHSIAARVMRVHRLMNKRNSSGLMRMTPRAAWRHNEVTRRPLQGNPSASLLCLPGLGLYASPFSLLLARKQQPSASSCKNGTHTSVGGSPYALVSLSLGCTDCINMCHE